MDITNLVRMANRIGDFFEAMADRDEAVEGVAQHLDKFWEPRMRRLLQKHVAQGDADDLHPLVALAVRRRADALQ
ncbi:formate dehydrogenase subunit delta [Azohydromonas lata]|uniref:Formate dehydrogenase subunit delta n=1 Tax=Azohydromonas lata TaxID=45677 RepID=A0ABU5IQD6_9BURK|nr:formate dehydrogenase subunit delta [Azohydromonas lata]MDZ5461112.1 formate dehydrogenase subunit delta [Azohydromonas lata]